jgi:hypothetical protein
MTLHTDLASGITLGAQLLMLINSCINPIIYNFMSGKYGTDAVITRSSPGNVLQVTVTPGEAI